MSDPRVEAGAKALYLRERKYHTPTKECPTPPEWEDLTGTGLAHYMGNAAAMVAAIESISEKP